MKMTTFEKHFVNAERHSRRVAAAMISRLQEISTRPGQHLLEVGCGNGTAALSVAAALQLEVTGVDVDPDQVTLARRAAERDTRVHFEVADATSLPFESGAFDIVATNKTLHHIAEWTRAVTELVRVLKPGGHLVITDLVAPRWGASVAERVLGQRPATADALDRVIRKQGLQPVRESVSFALFQGVWRRLP
jgi:ubiquinone/menaquinone biosynthesis C-methylase UbiE